MDRGTRSQNRFAQRADLYLATADAQAQRIADGWNEQPADSRKLTPDDIRQMWQFSPSEQPATDFWTLHDQVLADNLNQLGANPTPDAIAAAHNQAEMQALQAVYPNRAQLAGLGSTELDQQVQRTQQIQRLVAGQQEH